MATLLTLSILAVSRPSFAASASQSGSLVQDDQTVSTCIEDQYSTLAFLHKLGICPDKVHVDEKIYTSASSDDLTRIEEKLRHIENECTEPATNLFYTQTNEANFEHFLHTFIILKLAIKKLFYNHSSSMSSLSMPSKRSSSNNTQHLSLQHLINSMDHKEIRSAYWDILDEQPDTHLYKKPNLFTQEARKTRETISDMRNWLKEFKAQQQHVRGIAISSSSSSSNSLNKSNLEVLGALHTIFENRRNQIRADRERVQGHIEPGLAALAALKGQAMPNNPAEYNPSQNSSCTHQ